MQVQNNTNQILVFGRAVIPPQQAGTLGDEFEDHPTVDLLIRLRKIVPLAHAAPVESPPVRVESFTPPTAPADPTPVVFETDDQIPAAFDEWHSNKCYAWIRKQDNPSLLSKMAAIEDRAKVRVRLEKRIEEIS